MTRWARQELHGWGRVPRIDARVARPEERSELLRILAEREGSLLAYGLGRSYGDAPLLTRGGVVRTERLDRMLGFDAETGWLRVEAGVTLQDIARTFAPRGWFPPVVPGTWFVTAAGALANDIHGKNHHVDGTWADHVRRVELLTADGIVVWCDADTEPELFWATVGGLGLTGLILSLEVRLVRIASPWLEVETLQVPDLDAFFVASAESAGFTHTVTWVDASKRGRHLGRGLVMRGRWTDRPPRRASRFADASAALPVDLPGRLLNRHTVSLFNAAFYRQKLRRRVVETQHYVPFFFPLDAVSDWNRAYGARGFYQYQLVVPPDPDHRAVRAALEAIAGSGMASFLAVIKEFGPDTHPWLSFPRPGTTLALDFPNVGPRLLELFTRLDRIVLDAGGRVYLGKDARLSRDTFRAMYADWEGWRAIRDRWDPTGVFRSDLAARLDLVGVPA